MGLFDFWKKDKPAPQLKGDFTGAESAKESWMIAREMIGLATLYSYDQWTIAGGSSSIYGSHPLEHLHERLYGQGMDHFAQMNVLHLLRHMIPVLNNAFIKRRQLEGVFTVESDDDGLQTALTEFIEKVPVGQIMSGGTTRGLEAYMNAVMIAGDEFGMGLGEPVLDEQMRNIEYLYVADIRTISLERVLLQRASPGPNFYRYRLRQNLETGPRYVESPLVDRVTFSTDGTDPWPMPMIWGLEVVAELIAKMTIALTNLYTRVGDPSYLRQIVYEPEAFVQDEVTTKGVDGNNVQIDRNLYNLQQGIMQHNMAKLRGMAVDLSFSLKGGKIEQEPLMADVAGASMSQWVAEHYDVIQGLIVDRSDCPPWMFSMGNNQAEGIGSNKAQVLAQMAMNAARKRQKHKAMMGKKICDLYLLTQGAAASIGRYTCNFETTSQIDQKLENEAEKIKAESVLLHIQAAFELYGTGEIDEEGNAVLNQDQIDYLVRRGVIIE